MNILIIEDDKETAGFIVKGLSETGYKAEAVYDGATGLQKAQTGNYDLLIVDRMLPKVDGLTIIKSLRDNGFKTPVLILSALGEVDDRVVGLQAGGDDYLVKPYAFSELLARLQALLRRDGKTSENMILEIADLRLDRLKRKVTRADQIINLQPREYRLLEYLMINAGQIVTRTMLLEKVWEYHFDPGTNIIDVHISRLRTKIDNNFKVKLIHTERGAGYTIADYSQYVKK